MLGRFVQLWQNFSKKKHSSRPADLGYPHPFFLQKQWTEWMCSGPALRKWRHGANTGRKDRRTHSCSRVPLLPLLNRGVKFPSTVCLMSQWLMFLPVWHHLCLLCVLQWVPRWAAPSGSASRLLCPPRGLSQASWPTCLGPWWASAWVCWFSAATKRVFRNSAPGGSSSSPSLPSFFSPSSGTYLLMSCWGCRYHLLPDEGPLRSHQTSSPTFTLIQTKVPLWPQVI